MVQQGHEVTLFASADSVTSARLVCGVESGLRLKKDCIDPLAHHIEQMQEVIKNAHEFDILHLHTDYLHFPFTDKLSIPTSDWVMEPAGCD